MGLRLYTLIGVLLLLFSTKSMAQSTSDYAIQLSAVTQTSPPKITLQWTKVSGVSGYKLYKKSKTAGSFGTAIATLTTADSSYADNGVVVDSAYEYAVIGTGGTTPSGYIYAGIKCPAIHNRGMLVLIVDSVFIDSFANEITRLMNDVRGDGWQLIRHNVGRSMRDTAVKRLIKNDYSAHSNLQAVFLLGHIAVPYSGALNPDGHGDHYGAWPADAYYGDMNGVWTDATVTDTASAILLANRNAPGDGKWDQSDVPTPMELQVGRVDFYNMPAFGKTEVQLMRSYLNRDHLYKMDSLNIPHRGLVDDNFGAFSGEAFAANAWRNFPVLFGRNNIASLDFISTLKDSAYLWAYGCGGGYFTSAGGIGNTTDFAANNVNSIFTILFGSYFGDWNVQNNFLRAPLCSNIPALTCFWAGRPNWFFHHMALGENIGYAARLTQNNSIYNFAGYGQNGVHVALMGDLTLREDYIKPPSGLIISTTPPNSGAHLSWTASPDPGVIGYYIYCSDSELGNYKKVSPLITTLAYSDTAGTNGLRYYMVRPVKLQQTPSGNYYNLGIGITDSATVYYPVSVKNVGNNKIDLLLFPNPANDKLNLIINSKSNMTATLYVVDGYGKKILNISQHLEMGKNAISIDVNTLVPGVYTLIVSANGQMESKKWIKAN